MPQCLYCFVLNVHIPVYLGSRGETLYLEEPSGYLEEPVRVASPTRINLEEPVRVASPTRINLEEPVRVASTTRINLEEPGQGGQPT